MKENRCVWAGKNRDERDAIIELLISVVRELQSFRVTEFIVYLDMGINKGSINLIYNNKCYLNYKKSSIVCRAMYLLNVLKHEFS